MKKSYILLGLTVFCFISCKTEQKNKTIETITVNTENIISFEYDKYVSENSIIPLQIKQDHYLGNVKKLYIQDNIAAIISNEKVFIYAINDGSLLHVIDRKGKGPGEYQAIDDIYIENEFVYVLDRLKRAILIFDLNGNYINMIETGLIGYSFIKTDKDHFAIYINSDISKESDYRLNLYSLRDNNIEKKFFKISEAEYRWQYIIDLRNFICNQGKIFFLYSFNYEIYDIQENKIKPAYIVDFGKNKVPPHFLRRNYDDIMEFTIKAFRKNYIYSIIGFHHTNNYIYFAYRHNNKFIHCIYSRINRKVISFDIIKDYLGVKGLNEETSFYNFPLSNDDNYFYAIIEPNLLREKLIKLNEFCPDYVIPILNSQENDNPFLLKFKLSNM